MSTLSIGLIRSLEKGTLVGAEGRLGLCEADPGDGLKTPRGGAGR